MKTLIVYRSKYGCTKQYAEWTKEEMPSATLMNIRSIKANELITFDQIILLSCVYIGRMSATGFIARHWPVLNQKKVFLIAVGMEEDTTDSKPSFQLLPEEIQNGISAYIKLPGRMDLDKMGFFDRLIIKKMGGKTEDKTDRALLKAFLEQ
jgi:menaquinone-dependent protoporphyrinogen IX oxidase